MAEPDLRHLIDANGVVDYEALCAALADTLCECWLTRKPGQDGLFMAIGSWVSAGGEMRANPALATWPLAWQRLYALLYLLDPTDAVRNNWGLFLDAQWSDRSTAIQAAIAQRHAERDSLDATARDLHAPRYVHYRAATDKALPAPHRRKRRIIAWPRTICSTRTA